MVTFPTNQTKNQEKRAQADTSLQQWREEEKQALQLLKIVGELRFDKGIELVFFRRDIYDARPSELLKNHQSSIKYGDLALHISDTLSLAQLICDMETLPACKIDLGKLGLE